MIQELTHISDLGPAVPEILLAISAMVLLMLGAFGGNRMTPVITGISVAVLAAAAVLLMTVVPLGETFEGALVVDTFARFMKVVTLFGSAVAIAMSVGFARAEHFETFEYPILILLATLGMLMMISATTMLAARES